MYNLNLSSLIWAGLIVFGVPVFGAVLPIKGQIGRCQEALIGKNSSDQLLLDIPQKPRGVSPISRELLEKYSVNEVANAITTRIRAEEEKVDIGPRKAIDLMRDTDVIIFFRPTVAPEIATRGFLNFHQTRNSNGGLDARDPAQRTQAEDRVTGLDLGQGELSNQLRPKSAFLNVKPPIEFADKWLAMVDSFGRCAAVFNSEVKRRSIWLSGDSLNLGLDASEDKIEKSRGTFHRGALPTEAPDQAYYEVLVYGTLTVEDVDYFLADEKCDTSALQVLNKPIYSMKKGFRNERWIFEKGNCLSSNPILCR